MDDAFRHPCGSRGIEDEDRVVERKPGKFDRRRSIAFQKRLQRSCVRKAMRLSIRAPDIIEQNDMLEAWQLSRNRLDPLSDVDGFAIVVIAVAGNEELGTDLTETVENAAFTKVRRAG